MDSPQEGVGVMPKYKIVIDRDECIGDGLCCGEAPATFAMDDEDKAVVTIPGCPAWSTRIGS